MSDYRSDPKAFNESVIREFRANQGVVGGELAGMRLLLLTTLDARSGQPRTTPLACHQRGSRYTVIASNGGATRDPQWFENLRQSPNVTVEVGADTFPARARILEGRERDVAFADVLEHAPSAKAFQEQAGRPIPVVELERASPYARHDGVICLGGDR